MSELYNRIGQLCETRGITITEMCRLSGASRGSLTDLKKDRINTLKAETLKKIADLFEVSIDYLITGELSETEKAPALTKKDERDIEKRLEAMIGDLEGNADGLMFSGEPMDEETRELLKMSLRNQLEISKRLAKQKYTPKKYRKEGE